MEYLSPWEPMVHAATTAISTEEEEPSREETIECGRLDGQSCIEGCIGEASEVEKDKRASKVAQSVLLKSAAVETRDEADDDSESSASQIPNLKARLELLEKIVPFQCQLLHDFYCKVRTHIDIE